MPAVAAAVLLAGCSSTPSEQKPPPGELVAGTAEVTVDGVDTGTTQAVQCVPAGSLTTITTGDQRSGITALISNESGLVVKSVSVRDVAGFTGSYNEGLGGKGAVTMTGRTYDIAGTADGFRTAQPAVRASVGFAIKVSC